LRREVLAIVVEHLLEHHPELGTPVVPSTPLPTMTPAAPGSLGAAPPVQVPVPVQLPSNAGPT
jgi:hypothetical protein